MSFNIDNFSTMILTPIIIILGLFGNLFGPIVISKKKLKKEYKEKKMLEIA